MKHLKDVLGSAKIIEKFSVVQLDSNIFKRMFNFTKLTNCYHNAVYINCISKPEFTNFEIKVIQKRVIFLFLIIMQISR